MPDVITFGEVMVRLAPPHFQRLEQARSLDVEIGGAELNTAAGLVRLGRSAAWVSRAAGQPARPARRQPRPRDRRLRPVRAVRPPTAACGLYFLEFGAAPRASSILYDRKDSAIAEVTRGHVRLADDLRRGEVVPRHRHHRGAEPGCGRGGGRGDAGGAGRRA